MRYYELNKTYEDLRTLNFYAAMLESKIAQIIKQVFANYLGVSDSFIPDENITQKCLPHNEKTEIKGWSYVSLYACNNENQLELVRDFDKIKIPMAMINEAPSELKAQIPTEIDNCHDATVFQIRESLFNKPEYTDFANKFDQFINAYSTREYHFDSITDNGYFIFYLGICFASSERSYPKNIIPIKLGISLHKDDVVELAIFDTESEYEKICFTLNPRNINLFELSTLVNDDIKIKYYLEKLNGNKESMEHTFAKSIINLVTNNNDYQDLYSCHTKEVTFCPNYKSGDYLTKERKIVEYIQFNTSDIKKWKDLINSENFKKLAQLIPDEILDRICLRYKWFMDKNYNYYYKQVNPKKDKAYLPQSGAIIHNPIYNYAPKSTYTKQHSSGNDQTNIANNSSGITQKNNESNFTIKKLAPTLFGSIIGTGIALTISKISLILTYIKGFIK